MVVINFLTNLFSIEYDTMYFTLIAALTIGTLVMILTRRLKIPAIPLLFLAGVFLGKEFLGIIDLTVMGSFYKTLISLCVAIILFEGGLTLDYQGYRQADREIKQLLSVGVTINWLIGATCIYYLFDFSILFSLFASSLIIFTGPAVLLPILRRIQCKKNVHHVLHWEGVLNDPIGVFIAIFCFELIIENTIGKALSQFVLQIVIGTTVGISMGFVAVWLLKKKWITDDLVKPFVLVIALFSFGLAERFVHEAGLLSSIITGFVIGFKKPVQMKGIKQFKSEITDISIALVFILLSSNLNFDNLSRFGWKGFGLVACVIFIARPISVFLSTINSKLNTRDKIFISWLAPRGVIAASMATLLSLRLQENNIAEAWFVEIFTFSVIASTVMLQGFSANTMARLLSVKRKVPTGWLLIGANAFSEAIANFLTKKAKKEVIILDVNRHNVADILSRLKQKNFHAYSEDALNPELLYDERFMEIGNLLALTDNLELNALLCHRWREVIHVDYLYRWLPTVAEEQKLTSFVGKSIWSNLPKPSIIADELTKANLQVVSTHHNLNKNGSQLSENADLLFQTNSEGHINLIENSYDWKENTTTTSNKNDKKKLLLYLLKRNITLADFLQENLIYSTQTSNLKDILSEALKKIKEIKWQQLPDTLLLDELLKPDRVNTYGLGKGWMMPHAFINNLNEAIVTVVKLEKQIVYPTYDNLPIHFVCVALYPKTIMSRHLSLLSSIAKILNKESYDNLISSRIKSGKTILKALTQASSEK